VASPLPTVITLFPRQRPASTTPSGTGRLHILRRWQRIGQLSGLGGLLRQRTWLGAPARDESYTRKRCRVKVIVIGSTGQLGQDLLKAFGPSATGLNHQDLEITDGVQVAETFQNLRPDWVLNTAAFHRVDDCELNPGLAFDVNALGARNVARATAAIGAGVLFFSTDYVFGGAQRERGRPYRESDQPAPLNVYGISKLAGEQLVLQSNPRSLVIRSTGLYGTATSRKGWTFPELMLNKAKSDGVVKVVKDQVLAPTYTADLAAKVKELVEKDAAGLFHVTNADECSWFEFARGVFDLAGTKVEMHPIETTQSQRRAHRPAYSALASHRLTEVGLQPMRPWREALKAYLQAKGVI
jgi:dTDP-4-dehydrorhamnose reductase